MPWQGTFLSNPEKKNRVLIGLQTVNPCCYSSPQKDTSGTGSERSRTNFTQSPCSAFYSSQLLPLKSPRNRTLARDMGF